jgi:protoporphyrinogen/coproporphyrinogen III oxidase
VVMAAALLLALPAWRAAQLLRSLAQYVAETLAAIRYLPSLTVSLAYRAPQVGKGLEGTGFVAKPDGWTPLRACTYASVKFAGRAPAGHVLLRAFLAPVSEAPAVWSRTYEWPQGIPFYGVDHAVRMAEVRRRLAGLGTLALAGAGYDGAGVGACLKSGREAMRQLLKVL